MSEELKTLGNLSPAKGSHKNRKRIGRGIGSGWGKTAAKGHKGQKARKGGGIAPGFEGGQTPLYRRLPKRGFVSPNKKIFNVVNLDQLEVFNDGQTIDGAALKEAGLLRRKGYPVKLLARGNLSKKLNVVVDKASKTAKAAVEKAGGSIKEN